MYREGHRQGRCASRHAVEGDQICQRNGQPWQCGDDATRTLQTLLDGGEVTCTEVDRNRYGRSASASRSALVQIGAVHAGKLSIKASLCKEALMLAETLIGSVNRLMISNAKR